MLGLVVIAAACSRAEVSSRDAAASAAVGNTKPRQVRTVYVTRMATTWYEDGSSSTVPAPDVASIAVDAIVPDDQGGTTTIAGVLDGGTWTLSSVPVGRYTLRVVGAPGAPLLFLQVAGNHIDLGYDSAVREGIQVATTSTVATLELSGLSPWTGPDYIELFSWAPSLYQKATSPFASGVTSGDAIFDFANGAWTPKINPLLVASDRLYLAQFQATMVGDLPYWRAVSAASVTGIGMANGTPVTVPVAMAPVPQDRSATIDWRTTEFEAHLAEVGAGAEPRSTPHVFASYGEPLPPALSLSASTPDFLVVYPPLGADVNLGTVTYGSYAPGFGEKFVASFLVRVPRALPGATSVRFQTGIDRREAVVPSPIVPAMTPVRSVTIEGLDAMKPQAGVGLTPFISWEPPGVGDPESYSVTVHALGRTADGRTTRQFVFRLLTEDPGVRVPPGMLAPGTSYVFLVDASRGTEPAAPSRLSIPYAYAGFVSEVFTP